MGMAASQARYLELTARKTNVEYAGQQINQQRTSLANESAGMFSQLMALQAPTPPSTSQFTTTSYTFNDGANAYTIPEGGIAPLTGDPDYNSNVTYTYDQTNYTGVAKTRIDLGVKLDAGTYWLTNGDTGGTAINMTKLVQCSLTDPDYATDKGAIEQVIANVPTATNFATDYSNGIGNIYKYTAGGVTNYYSKTDLDAMPVDGSANSLDSYYAADITTSKSLTEKAYVTKTQDGRYSKIQLASESNNTLNLDTTSSTDEVAYQDAMNQYTYNQQTYESQIQSINAKTEIIQQEDKTLELELRQLDTEQKALSTEMDAVKKVIQKNIETTFKTFS